MSERMTDVLLERMDIAALEFVARANPRLWRDEAERARASEVELYEERSRQTGIIKEQAGEIERLKADNAALRTGATSASAELRHTYRPETRDWNLVARAIRILEGVTTTDHPGTVLLKEKAQQIETIKALAAELRAQLDEDDGHIAACGNGGDDDEDCSPRCVRVRELLGRLP